MRGVTVIPGGLHSDTAIDLFGPIRGCGDTSVLGRAYTTGTCSTIPVWCG